MIELINAVFTLLYLAILARVLLSWVDQNPYPDNELKRILYQVTDPILEPVREWVPPVGGIDFSPIVALIGLQLIQAVLVELLGGGGF